MDRLPILRLDYDKHFVAKYNISFASSYPRYIIPHGRTTRDPSGEKGQDMNQQHVLKRDQVVHLGSGAKLLGVVVLRWKWQSHCNGFEVSVDRHLFLRLQHFAN